MTKKSLPIETDRTWLWSLAVIGGFLAFLAMFLQQDSMLGLSTEEGTNLNRLAELLVMPQYLNGLLMGGSLVAPIDRLPVLCSVLIWLLLAGVIGRPAGQFVFGRDGAHDSSERERCGLSGWGLTAFNVLFGLGVLSTTVMLLGWTGMLGSRWPLLIACIGLTAGAFLLSRRIPASASQSDSGDEEDLQLHGSVQLWSDRLIRLACWCFAIGYILSATLPPAEFDVLEYHLQAPREIAQQGYLDFNPDNVYANMPLGTEMHSAAWMVLLGADDNWKTGGTIGKTVCASFSLLSAILLCSFLSGRYGSATGYAAACMFLALPGNMHVAANGLIDIAFASYLLIAITAVIHLWPQFRAGQGRAAPPTLILGSIAGFATACKYTGIPFVVVPLASILAYAAIKKTDRQTALALLWFSIGIAIAGGPWLAKNAVLTGNPVFPLASSWFGAYGLEADQIERWNQVHRPQPSGGASAFAVSTLWESLRRLVWSSPMINPAFQFLGLCGLIAMAIKRRRDWTIGWLLTILWIAVVWLAATHRIDRFWLPITVLTTALVAIGFREIASRTSPIIGQAIVFFGMGYGALLMGSGAAGLDNRLFVSYETLAQQDARRYDGTGFQWANSNLRSEEKLLLVGDARAYLYEVPILYSTCFNTSPGERILKGTSVDEQLSGLVSNGITHILIDWPEINRYRSPGNYGFSEWPQLSDVQQMERDGLLRPMADAAKPGQTAELYEVMSQ